MRSKVSSKPRRKTSEPFSSTGLLAATELNAKSEIFESSEAALAHRSNLRDLSLRLFGKLVSPHLVIIYGDPSPELLEKVKEGGVDVKVFSFLAGL
jgi:hypothetical protein